MIPEKKTFSYKSKIRYDSNKPYRSENFFYPSPSKESDEKLQIILERERLYRHDFKNSFKSDLQKKEAREIEETIFRHEFPKPVANRRRDDESLFKISAKINSVPCHGATKYFLEECVLVKRNSSIIPYDQEVIPSSQVSTLPLATQIPRPPFSNPILPYLPLAKYKSNLNNLVKSLPSVRSKPQYPSHNSYVLAKLKRSDIPKK